MFVSSPTKESTRGQWTAERCMVMVLPITAQRCSNIQETAQLRITRHTARQSTMTLPPKKRHQGILNHRARVELELECHYRLLRSHITNHEHEYDQLPASFDLKHSDGTIGCHGRTLYVGYSRTHHLRGLLLSAKHLPRMPAESAIPSLLPQPCRDLAKRL